jgi:hypothetical protein
MQSPVHMSNASGPWWRVLAAWLPLAVTGCATLPEAPIPAPTGTKSALVVLDIDGTLTPHNLRVHEARPGAAETVRAFESRGYEIVYITARVPAFQASLPAWLAEHGFPVGNLHVAQSREERRNPADFKARVLNRYVAQGWRLAYGFGDSTTDFLAYQRAGLAGDRVFALRREGQETCEEGVYHACLDDWDDARPFVVADPPRVETAGDQ